MSRAWLVTGLLGALLGSAGAEARKPARVKQPALTNVEYALPQPAVEEDDNRWMLPQIGDSFEGAPATKPMWKIRGTRVKVRVPI